MTVRAYVTLSLITILSVLALFQGLTVPSAAKTPSPRFMVQGPSTVVDSPGFANLEPASREQALQRANRSLHRAPVTKPVKPPRKPVVPRRAPTSHPPAFRPPTGVVKAYALALVGSTSQFACLDALWTRESHWNPFADNKHSSAYGIAQLLGETSRDYATQIRHGLSYISHRKDELTPCGAWAHSQRYGWY